MTAYGIDYATKQCEELLRNGIHVISTVNVQHLESLYDLVERFTGVKVKERVPDYIVSQADQIVNVDLPAEDLQERLRAGKIYAHATTTCLILRS